MKLKRGTLLLALLLGGLATAAASDRSGAVGSFGTSLYRIWNADDQPPAELVERIDDLEPPPGLTPAMSARMKLVANGIVMAQRGRVEDARQVIAHLQALESHEPVARADALMLTAKIDERLAQRSDRLRDAKAAVEAYEQLCSVDTQTCDYHYQSLAIESLMVAAELDDNMGMAALQAHALLTLAKSVHDRIYEAYGLLALAEVAQQSSDRSGVDRWIAEARTVAASTDYPRLILTVGIFEGLIDQERGNYAAARAEAMRTLSLALKANRRGDEMAIRVNLGEADAAMKQFREAMQQYAEALAYARQKRRPVFEAYVLSDLVKVEAAVHDFESARRDLGALRTLLATYSSPHDRLSTLKSLAGAMSNAGDQADAMDLLQEAQKLAFSSGPTAALLRQQASQQEAADQARQATQFKWRIAGTSAALIALAIGLIAWRLRQGNRRLERSRHALLQRADRDPLTGLVNRRYLETLEASPEGLKGVLYLIDLDHFKRINDTRGHPAGDAVLVEVARRLRGVVRDGDAAIRWGGEEFLIHVARMSAVESDALAGRLLAALATVPVTFGDQPIPISASIGYAAFPLDAPAPRTQGLDEAFALVDAAMYRSKSHGRNRATGVRGLGSENVAQVLSDFDRAIEAGTISIVDVRGPTLHTERAEQRAEPQAIPGHAAI